MIFWNFYSDSQNNMSSLTKNYLGYFKEDLSLLKEAMGNLKYMDMNILNIVESYMYENRVEKQKSYLGFTDNYIFRVLEYTKRYGIPNGECVEYTEEPGIKKLKKRVNIVNGTYHGKVTYYENGKVSDEMEYVYGVRDGARKVYDKKGNITMLCHYKNNLLEGEYIMYDRNETMFFKKGKRHGSHKVWGNGGKLMLSCSYKDDVLVGEYLQWYNNGNIMCKIVYNDKGEKIYENRWSETGKEYKLYGGGMWM